MFSAGFSARTLISKDIPGVMRLSFFFFFAFSPHNLTMVGFVFSFSTRICMRLEDVSRSRKAIRIFRLLVLLRHFCADLPPGIVSLRQLVALKLANLDLRPGLDGSTSHRRLRLPVLFGQYFVQSDGALGISGGVRQSCQCSCCSHEPD